MSPNSVWCQGRITGVRVYTEPPEQPPPSSNARVTRAVSLPPPPLLWTTTRAQRVDPAQQRPLTSPDAPQSAVETREAQSSTGVTKVVDDFRIKLAPPREVLWGAENSDSTLASAAQPDRGDDPQISHTLVQALPSRSVESSARNPVSDESNAPVNLLPIAPESELPLAETHSPPADETLAPTHESQNAKPFYGGEPNSDAINQNWQLAGSQPRSISLVEAIHTSLVTKRVIHSLGSDVVVETTTRIDPEIFAQQITLSESRFDPVISSRVGMNHIDLPPSSFFGAGIPVANQRDEIEFNARLSKQWATGATTSVGYEPSLAYLYFPDGNPGGFNPTQSADLVLQAVQPLLRGAGAKNNLATIRIAQQRQLQATYSVETKLQQQLRSIEQVYWALHAGHVRRRAIGEAIQLSQQIVEIEKLRYEAGRVIYADVARASVKLEDLFQQKLAAEKSIQQLSLQVSQLTGMDVDGNALLVPLDAPQRQPPLFQKDAIVGVALQRNPKLLQQRQEIAVRQNQLQLALNQLRPQLDLRSSVRSSGLNDDLGSALGDMAKVEFVDLSVGLVYTRPVGNRAARSQYRQAELELARTSELLIAFERQAAFAIVESLNSTQLAYARFESALRQLEQAQEWVRLAKVRYQSPPDESGQEALLVALLDYQTAIQAHVDAMVGTALALADYNSQLATVEEQRGTLLDRWNIAIAAQP